MKEKLYQKWMDRAYDLMSLWELPLILTREKGEYIQMIGVILILPWVVVTLPIQLLLIAPISFCVIMATNNI